MKPFPFRELFSRFQNRELAILVCVLLTGCSSGGLLVGDPPDRWAKRFCFNGQGQGSAGVPPWASGDLMGSLITHGVTSYGTMPDDVLLELSRQPCNPVNATRTP